MDEGEASVLYVKPSHNFVEANFTHKGQPEWCGFSRSPTKTAPRKGQDRSLRRAFVSSPFLEGRGLHKGVFDDF
ncbi:MAG: hypothetical protein ACJ8BW_20600, partial [Ktedonobacteraceae bacterium]